MSPLLPHTAMMLAVITLIIPIVKPGDPMKPPNWNTSPTKTAVKSAFLITLVPLMAYIDQGMSATITNLHWITPTTYNFNINFILDFYPLFFVPIALLITWSIMDFSVWYMASDPNIYRFFNYLFFFLVAMLILVTAGNMFQLFVGWEGVGIMSFLLIGWWLSRSDANSSALQAVIYNRVGDIGLLMTLAWLMVNENTWEIQLINQASPESHLPLLGLVLAAAGKSAQFGLHPWLPAAMEGPTPVSALLHSSTMVIAGIFLLVRLHPLLETHQSALTACLCLGAMTTLFAATCALMQNDIKKIIAFSTSSQLGLMMVTIGLNQPQLAFLHISTHAFFKALLFLCSGSIIHSLADEQDIRKMGGLQKILPITTTCLTIGNLALMGTPFLAGFYSKDTIIETMNTSHLNAWALSMTILATALTAAYSMRIIYYVQLNNPHHNPTAQPAETNKHMTSPLLRLASGSIIMGLLIITTTLPTKTSTMTMPPIMKLTALVVTLTGLLLTTELTKQMAHKTHPKHYMTKTFSAQLGFFNTLFHRNQPKLMLSLGKAASTQLTDLYWYEKIGPKSLALTNITAANISSESNKGLIKTYLLMFATLTATALLFLKF
uniref:NADH-ubiquinone oxidoreductase chain 5 n=1 Tax=Lepidophyma flavimaculatum TaxID=264485 RepID=A1IGH9_9SAUR|nr:NADH dehydrogenase subunit 5 [Lepidophyma flavimaculatum]BAF43989.1 NADH dehydrogenase subunit 5 [Lepidophyma flavimaculatum]